MENIKNLSVDSYGFVKGRYPNRTVEYRYSINKDTDDAIYVNIIKDYDTKEVISTIITNRLKTEMQFSSVEQYGFRIERDSNNLFRYHNLETDEFSESFDIATAFNEYGLAMVGNDKKVFWISKDFKELDKYNALYAFSDSKNPIAKVTTSNNTYYLNTLGEVIDFQIDAIDLYTKAFKWDSGEFNEQGIAKAGSYILFDNRTCISKESFIDDVIYNNSNLEQIRGNLETTKIKRLEMRKEV